MLKMISSARKINKLPKIGLRQFSSTNTTLGNNNI